MPTLHVFDRQLPASIACHQAGSSPSAVLIVKATWIPDSSMAAGEENEPTSTSEPVLRSQAKLRLERPKQEPQRSPTPAACASSAARRIRVATADSFKGGSW